MSNWRAERRAIIRNDATRAAFDLMIHQLEAEGMEASPNVGAVRAVRFHDHRIPEARQRYVFSFIVNQHHLLFYIRLPAQNLRRELKQAALDALAWSNVNPKGEVTIRIETAAQAASVMQFLKPRLPLS